MPLTWNQLSSEATEGPHHAHECVKPMVSIKRQIRGPCLSHTLQILDPVSHKTTAFSYFHPASSSKSKHPLPLKQKTHKK